MTLSEELTWRGFVNQTTFPEITALDDQPITFYWGVDPSASSMTIGNLAAAMMVRHFIDHGHKAILLVGGATGMIGDPDGKKDERNLQTIDDIAINKDAIAKQYQTVFAGQEFEIVDNYDWFKNMNYLDFLRDIGKHVPLSAMLGREFIQSRLGEGGSGISYAEFSYSLIQGYDYLHLHREKGATLQVCGADQWGNSIAGVDLIRRVTGSEAHVYSTPLIVNKTTGVKFGKSEDGAVWLDPLQTSIYKYYQFWLNADDAGVGDYLKVFTLLDKTQFDEVMAEFEQSKAGRHAQKTLAYEATKLVHGQAAADSMVRITNVLFGGGELSQVSSEDIALLKAELPTGSVASGDSIMQSLVDTGLVSGTSEARRFIEQGGITVNGNKVGLDFTYSGSDKQVAGAALLRRGKNLYAVIDITG